MPTDVRPRPLRTILSVAGVVALLAAPAAAQIPDHFENLQVFPKDVSRRELIGAMRGFAFALGVRCQFCHVGEEGADLSTFNFKSDEKPTKRTARIMLRMVQSINQDHLSQLDTISGMHDMPGHEHHADRVAVQCVTCHRGVSRPVPLEQLLGDVVADSGVDAGVRRYLELKARYYGGFAYDFQDRPLLALAGDRLRQGDTTGAMTFLRLNLQANPTSWQTFLTLGDAFAGMGQRDSAIANYKRSLEIQPDNLPAQQRLQRVQG